MSGCCSAASGWPPCRLRVTAACDRLRFGLERRAERLLALLELR